MSATSMVAAVTAGDEATVRRLLEADPGRAREHGPDGVSALLVALYHGRTDLVELLRPLAGPFDLYEAAALGDTTRLATLLQGGVHVEARSPDGFTALHLGAFFARPDAVRMLLAAGAGPDAVSENAMRVTPLHSAAAARDAWSVQALLAAGATPDAVQRGGHTPLMAAARNGDGAIVRALLALGADRDRPNDAGETARALAHPAVVGLLDRAAGSRHPA